MKKKKAFLNTEHSIKYFSCIRTFNPLGSSMRLRPFLFPLYRRGNRLREGKLWYPKSLGKKVGRHDTVLCFSGSKDQRRVPFLGEPLQTKAGHSPLGPPPLLTQGASMWLSFEHTGARPHARTYSDMHRPASGSRESRALSPASGVGTGRT